MPRASSNGIEIEYDAFGDAGAPPLLLVMGLGAQMIRWTPEFCEVLAGRGFRVVRFDNRDVGLSTHLNDAGVPDMAAIMGALAKGERPTVPYTLFDMAADAVGLLDALSIPSAHVVGASMGGMIAQLVASEHPGRTRSLTSIMSNTGNPASPRATAEAMAVINERPPHPSDEAAFLAHSLRGARTIGSPGFPFDEAAEGERILAAVKRAYDPAGFGRQLAAITATGDRRERLRTISAPTLVIHGADDPLVPLGAGEDTAANIPGARLEVIAGMGHDIPSALYGRIADLIAANAARAA